MLVNVDGKRLFELSDVQKKVIKNDVDADIFDSYIKTSLFYIINHKYNQCFRRLKVEWDKKLEERGIKNIPLNKDKYAELVFSQEDYKDAHSKNILHRSNYIDHSQSKE